MWQSILELPRKTRQVHVSLKCMLILSLTCIELWSWSHCTGTSCEATYIYMQTFYNICKKMCCKNSLRSGALYIGLSITRMLSLALLYLWRNFWTTVVWLLLNTLMHIPYQACCDLPSFSETQIGTEWKDISWRQQNWRTVTCCICRVWKRTLTNASNTGAVTVTTLLSCMGSTLQGQHGVAGKCCFHWERNSVQKLYRPLYVQGVTGSSLLGTS